MKVSATRKQILELAEGFIRTKGYNSFSYHDIAAHLGLKNAAIHYHFPTKEVLGLEVIRENIDRFKLFESRVSELAPDQQLEEFIATYQQHCREGKVCLVGAISVEYHGLPETLTEVMKGLTKVISSWLETVLSRGKEQKLFFFEQSQEQKALMIISNLAAGIQLARFMGANVFDEIVRGIRLDLYHNKL